MALAQTTTIDFNDLSAGLFLTKSYDKDGFNFSINAGGGGQIITRDGEGYQASISLYDNNFEIGALTQWTIKKIDGTEFQFHSIFLKEPNIGASTSGTIQGFKNGNVVGYLKTVDFNGLKSFASDPDFYDIDEIRISAEDINFHLDHFTFGPIYSPVDTTPASVSSISIVGNPDASVTSINYNVNFNKSVTGVSTDDFQLTTTDTATGSISTVSGSGSSYAVTVNNIIGVGTIRLDLKGGTNIANANGNTGTLVYTAGPTFEVVAASVNAAPVVTPSSVPTVYEDDVAVALSNDFSVSDSDGDAQTLTFTITGGTLTIGTNGITFGGGGNGSASFTAAGTLTDINVALGASTFTPTPELYGENFGEISFTATDGKATSTVASVTFNIIGVNDDPTITGLPATITVGEDSTEESFDISNASIGDIDAGSGKLSLILVANGGVFDVAAGTGMTIHGNLTDSLTLTGNLINLNNYIDQPSNIYFRPDQDLSGNGAASIEVYLSDNGNTGTGGGQTLYQGVISVNITAVNDAPTVANPIPDQETSAGVAWSFQFAENTFTDVDNDNLTYSAQLSSGNALPTWLTFTPSTHTFSGTPTAANIGDYLITVIANDGNGEEVEDSFTLSVALNRPKPISVQSVNPDGSYKIGDVLTLQITFDQIVTVVGTPALSLETGAVGAVAIYSVGSVSSSLSFEYKVEEGQISSDLDYVSSGSLTLNGGSILNSNEIDADLTLPSPSSTGSLSANSAIQVDGIRPTASIEVTTTNLIYGNKSKVTVTFSEGIAELLSTHFTVENGEISDPDSDDGVVWTFDLTPTIGIEDPTNLIVLDNTAVVDLAGNAGVGTTQSNNYFIDTNVPNASIVVLDSVLTIGKSSVVVITFHEAISGMDYDAISVDSGHVLTDLESSDGITWTITFIPMNDREHASNTFRFYNWRVTDAAGNAGISTSTSNTYIVDTKAPVVSTKNIAVQLDSSGSIEITADMVDDGSSDGFDIASMTLSQTNFDCSHLGANTLTLTVTDEHGNSDSAEAIVTVEDTTPPVVVTRNITIQLDDTGNASITVAGIDNGSADACGIASMTLSQYDFDCSHVGDNTVTLTVTDVNGNIDTATAIVTVEDVLGPIVRAKNIIIQLDATGNASITEADLDDGSSNSCNTPSLRLSKSTFNRSDLGLNEVTLFGSDTFGKESSATANVLVLAFEDASYVYDGTAKLIQIQGQLPAGVNVVYNDNSRTDAGTQEVTATINGSNYNTLILTANLTVTKASQTITWNQELNFSGCDDVSEIVLTATASSGLPIVYSVDSTTVSDVIGNVLYIKQPGKVKVTASQVGNNNYQPAGNMEREVIISAPGLIRQHWDDVLFFDNSSNNVVSYQWYQNGSPILGATKQYYSAGGVLSGTYYAEGTTETGDVIVSCPLEIVTSAFSRKMTLFPNPVSSEQMFTVKLDFDMAELNGASITLFDMSGRLLNTTQVNNRDVVLYAPNQKGIYIIYLNLADGNYKTLNLLVK